MKYLFIINLLLLSMSLQLHSEIIFEEDFEGTLDSRISVITRGGRISDPGVFTTTLFGSNYAFKFGRSGCGSGCYNSAGYLNEVYCTIFRITLSNPVCISKIKLSWIEYYRNWGCVGGIAIDSVVLGYGPPYNIGRFPNSDNVIDNSVYNLDVSINDSARYTIDIHVWDITNIGEIYIDNIVIEGCQFPQIASEKIIKADSLMCNSTDLDSVWVKSIGQDTLKITQILFTGTNPNDFKLISPTLPQSIKVSDSLLLIYEFNPKGSGLRTANMVLKNNCKTSDSVWTISLSGQKDSINFAINNLYPDTLEIDLGVVCLGSIKDTTFTIQNKSTISTTLGFGSLAPPFSIQGVSEAKKEEEYEGEK